jgi:hypothetical protein
MTPFEHYELFRTASLVLLFLHFAILGVDWHRYVGRALDSKTLIKSKFISSLLIIFILLFLALSIFFEDFIVFFIVLPTVVARYIHIDRRYSSLSRGAGAVGYVPYFILVTLFFFELLLFLSENAVRLFPILQMAFSITWGIILINAGISKVQEGYLSGSGVRAFLANPLWSRFWKIFNEYKFPRLIFTILGFCGVLIEIISGVLIVTQKYAQIGAALMIILFLFINIFIKLLTLPALSMVSALFILTTPKHIEFELLFDGSSKNSLIILVVLFTLFFPILNVLGLFIVFNNSQTNLIYKLQIIFNKIPVFRWRVFTRPIVDTFVAVVSKNSDSSFENLNITALYKDSLKFNWRIRFASEVVILTSIVNTLKNFDYWPNFFKKLERYGDSLNCDPNSAYLIVLVWPEKCDKIYGWQFLFSSSTNGSDIFAVNADDRLWIDFPKAAKEEISRRRKMW